MKTKIEILDQIKQIEKIIRKERLALVHDLSVNSLIIAEEREETIDLMKIKLDVLKWVLDCKPCKHCKKDTPGNELQANKALSYGVEICDQCASKQDELIDSHLQNI